MIGFWVDDAGAFGIRNYMENRGQAIAERFAVHRCDHLSEAMDVPGGPQIFAGLDRLTPAARAGMGTLYDQLARLQPGVPLLNDPRRCVSRARLLERLADLGLNGFRAHRADAAETVTSFPVFVREAVEHNGSLTGLLGSPGALRRALTSLRVRGHRQEDLLIVEFCDASDRDGVFRKYSAFKLGEAIIPAHLMAARHWVVKAEGNEPTLAFAREDLAYVEENPHAQWLQRVFEIAGVGYGRIDYGRAGDQLQAWEININPTLGRGPGSSFRPRAPEVRAIWDRTRETYHSRLRAAFVALERGAAPTMLRLSLDPALLSRVARESAKRRRRGSAITLLRRLYWSPVGAPVRPLLARMFPPL